MIPRWIDYVFTISENPWQAGDLVADAQDIWDNTMGGIVHQVEEAGDPVYFLVNRAAFQHDLNLV